MSDAHQQMSPTSAAPTREVVLELDSVVKAFRDRHDEIKAVDGVDLTVHRGELVAMLGPNGAGKTTTIDMVLGLTTPTSGTVRVFGEGAHHAVGDGRVSAVLQTGGLLGDLTVRETMEMIASTFPGPIDVDAILRRVGIAELAKRRVAKCSGGEQQRLRFALALIPDPDLLVLDEPTTGMDVSARRAFWDTMHAEAANGRTVIFATHYLQEADEFAERIVLMANGHIIADGPTAEIRATAVSRHVSFAIDEDAQRGAVTRLSEVRDVHDVTIAGGRISLVTTAADDVARIVLDELGGFELEIVRGSLDDAFMMLTQPATISAAASADNADHQHAAR